MNLWQTAQNAIETLALTAAIEGDRISIVDNRRKRFQSRQGSTFTIDKMVVYMPTWKPETGQILE